MTDRKLDALIGEANALRAEYNRVRASERPSKAGVGVFAQFVIPLGYKRLARQIGSLWLDSSFEAQLGRLDGLGDAWRSRVLDFLGTVQALPASGRRGTGPGGLQTNFSKTQRYDRPETRLKNGTTFLDDLKKREIVLAEGSTKSVTPEPLKPRETADLVPIRYEAVTFPVSVVSKLPGPVRKSVEQATESYRGGMYEPAAVMLRKAVQNAIVLRFESAGVGNQVLKPSGDALPFPMLIEKAQQARLISSQQATALMRVKWLGDTAAHSYANEIAKEDIEGVLLIVRLALERIFAIEIRTVTANRGQPE